MNTRSFEILHPHCKSVLITIAYVAVLAMSLLPTANATDTQDGETVEKSLKGFHLDTYRTWLFRSFLPDEEDDADTLGFEFVSNFGFGNYDVMNISYLELADYPVAVPGYPTGNEEPGVGAASGINDFLTAFLFSKSGGHHGPHHFSLGFSAQLPTGSDDTLSSGKYSLGPAVDYEYDGGRFYAAAVALQLWSVGGDTDRKDVSMMMIKPMITYDLNEKWKAVYMPYGISIYWNKPSDQRVYLPLGGGIQRQFQFRNKESAFSVQLFENVERPDSGAEHDFRLMLELNF
jgi:hypothetical protein